MPSVCELKVALKAKGIKGITGLNKSGLEKLLKGGSNETMPSKEAPKKKDALYNKAEKFLNKMDKEMNKAKTVSHSVSGGALPSERNKPFTPAPTKGESPKIAEKKITKKAKPPQILRLTYKEPDEAKKETKPPPKLKKPKQTEDERIDMLDAKIQSRECLKLMKKAKLKTIADLKKYIIANHPDKVKNYDPTSASAILYRELSNCSTAFRNLKMYLASGAIKGFKGLPPDN
jgi:hypothetical protein